MKINHISKFSYHAKGHFLTFQREWFKNFSGDKLPDSQISLEEVDTNRFCHHFHICLTRLANNKNSTLKIRVLSSIFVQNWLEVGVILSISKWRSLMKTFFLLRRKAFADFLGRVILEISFLGWPQTPKCLSKNLIPWNVKSASLSMTYIWKAVGLLPYLT